jgi:ornithine decarboxylase
LLAEPGRYLAADCMTLLTSVVGTAERDGREWHYLDDGLYGSYSNVMTEDVHPPILALRELTDDGASQYEPVTLAGPTCDSADVIARDYPMPPLEGRRHSGQPHDGGVYRCHVVAVQRHTRHADRDGVTGHSCV